MMPLIVIHLSTALTTNNLLAFLTHIYPIAPGEIALIPLDSDEPVDLTETPNVKCDYLLAQGDFPVYLEVSVAPALMPGMNNTQSDYWFAQQACAFFNCAALIAVPPNDPYAGSGSRALIELNKPPLRVELIDELASSSKPKFVIDQSVPVVRVDETLYPVDRDMMV